jgi:hypothetical protein
VTSCDKAVKQVPDKIEVKTESKREETTDDMKMTDKELSERYNFMVCVLLALVYNMNSRTRQAVIDNVKYELRDVEYDLSSPTLTSHPPSIRNQIWLSGLFFNAVGRVAGQACSIEMKSEVYQRHEEQFGEWK